MVERRRELDRRYQRKKKLLKYKKRLEMAKDDREKQVILDKIRIISPWWVPTTAPTA